MKHDQQSFGPQSFAAARAYGGGAEDLVTRFMPMVRKLAWHLQGSVGPEIEAEDLIQAGLVALTECAGRQTGAEPESFAAYVKTRVRGGMIDLMRRSAPLSRGAMKRRRELRDAESRLSGQLGRPPSIAELAAAMHMEPGELEDMRAASAPMRFESIDDTYSDSDMAFSDQTPDSLTLLVSQEDREHLIAAIADLPERLQMVIQLYYVEEMNLSEVATVLGVSVPRTHQLKDQALRRIREQLG